MKVEVSPVPRRRSAALDLVRLFGIAVIVVAHAVPDGWVRTGAYVWHVPVFFFLTGYLWTPGRTMRDEVVRRWRTLGWPYLTWLALITALTLPPLLVSEGTGAAIRRVGAVVLGGGIPQEPVSRLLVRLLSLLRLCHLPRCGSALALPDLAAGAPPVGRGCLR